MVSVSFSQMKDTYLQKGDESDWVSVLQDTLNGCSVGPVSISGEFDSQTEAAVKEFHRAVGWSEKGGIVDSQTWTELENYPKLPHWEPSVAIPTSNRKKQANSEKAEAPVLDSNGFDPILFSRFSEKELGRNLYWSKAIDNKHIRRYTSLFEKSFGKGRFPWCAATVLWCLNNFNKQGGLGIPIRVPGVQHTLALVESWQQWAQSMGFYIDNDGVNFPQPGDLIIFDWDQKSVNEVDRDWDDHIGVFLRMDGNMFICAEGNAQSRETGGGRTGIFSRYRQNIQGWARLPKGCKYDSSTQKLVVQPGRVILN